MRTTVVLPDEVVDEVRRQIGGGSLSGFVREAVQHRLQQIKRRTLEQAMEAGYRAEAKAPSLDDAWTAIETEGPVIRRGEVWWVDLDPVIGSEVGKRRPAIVVQNDLANRTSPTVTVVPLSSSVDAVYPFQVRVEAGEAGLNRPGKAQCEQIRTLSRKRLVERVGSLGAGPNGGDSLSSSTAICGSEAATGSQRPRDRGCFSVSPACRRVLRQARAGAGHRDENRQAAVPESDGGCPGTGTRPSRPPAPHVAVAPAAGRSHVLSRTRDSRARAAREGAHRREARPRDPRERCQGVRRLPAGITRCEPSSAATGIRHAHSGEPLQR
jgi:mRNA interferase MazF